MKRKKWSKLEEQILLSKYSELLRSGTLAKLKTREKKFKFVAEHVNAVHHLLDLASFPFKWLWHDVSIKVRRLDSVVELREAVVKREERQREREFHQKKVEAEWERKRREAEGVVGGLGDGVGGATVKVGQEGAGEEA
ncbi:hypothetical protein JHK87_010125 [Glycine soja]|nr:hypothetical protein JHK87_010125 [Glycine soja]